MPKTFSSFYDWLDRLKVKKEGSWTNYLWENILRIFSLHSLFLYLHILHMSPYISVYISVHVAILLSVCLSNLIFVRISTLLPLRVPLHCAVYQCVYLCVCSVHRHVYVSVHVSVCCIEHDEEVLLLEDERWCSGGAGGIYSSSAAEFESTLSEPSAQGSLLTWN